MAGGVSDGDKFSLFPNPTQNYISLRWPSELSAAKLELLDLAGKLVMRKHLTSVDGITTFDLPDVASGTYLVRITADGFCQTEKLSILK